MKFELSDDQIKIIHLVISQHEASIMYDDDPDYDEIVKLSEKFLNMVLEINEKTNHHQD